MKTNQNDILSIFPFWPFLPLQLALTTVEIQPHSIQRLVATQNVLFWRLEDFLVTSNTTEYSSIGFKTDGVRKDGIKTRNEKGKLELQNQRLCLFCYHFVDEKKQAEKGPEYQWNFNESRLIL